MDPHKSAQDVSRCDLCKKAIAQMYCDFCHVNLCKPCIGEHIADDYSKHQIVPFVQRKSTLIYPTCATHPTKTCELQCKECDIPICATCSLSENHKKHQLSTLFEVYESKRQRIEKDLEDIESIISPTYEEIATGTEIQIENLEREYEKLTTEVKTHGKEWHKEIDNIVNKLTTEIKEMKIKHQNILKKHLDEIKQTQLVIEETRLSLKKVEESNEISLTIEYSSKTKEFRKLPPKVQVSMPTFIPKIIDTEQLYMFLGFLTPFSTKTDKNGYIMKKTNTQTKKFLKEPELIITIDTGFEELCSVACLSEEEIWIRARSISDIKCFNIQSSLTKTIKTKSDEYPNDIAVTSDGDLVYCNWKTRTIYKVKKGQTEGVIRLQGWIPSKLCVTSSGDLLVTMYSGGHPLISMFSKTQSRVVRYSGSTEKQTIQFDEEGKPLYSGNDYIKYISENRNLDICVADYEAGVVVVVNQAGKLRFRYTGRPSTRKNKPFIPCGISTDSQSQILTADCDNHCIHILDQDGQFLRYIYNCDLRDPYGLCVDKSDNLFVAEYNGKVKKIKYFL
ncbi:E3 ubiquitin-protein ligase Midline-1-like [Saccostrea cucullata]|uniref:E3 ubiquitin-protein ligase Midline-1-like n=1 Tax=Saccostrea cuccullata TaxID=36930 RepID=UPI002ED485BE